MAGRHGLQWLPGGKNVYLGPNTPHLGRISTGIKCAKILQYKTAGHILNFSSVDSSSEFPKPPEIAPPARESLWSMITS